MPVPLQEKSLTVCDNDIRTGHFFAQAITQMKSLLAFCRSLHPCNWFNDFSNIEVTLEEFASPKKQA